MTAQIINFAERRQQLLIKRNSFHDLQKAFWSLFVAYMSLGVVSYGVFASSIDSK